MIFLIFYIYIQGRYFNINKLFNFNKENLNDFLYDNSDI